MGVDRCMAAAVRHDRRYRVPAEQKQGLAQEAAAVFDDCNDHSDTQQYLPDVRYDILRSLVLYAYADVFFGNYHSYREFQNKVEKVDHFYYGHYNGYRIGYRNNAEREFRYG